MASSAQLRLAQLLRHTRQGLSIEQFYQIVVDLLESGGGFQRLRVWEVRGDPAVPIYDSVRDTSPADPNRRLAESTLQARLREVLRHGEPRLFNDEATDGESSSDASSVLLVPLTEVSEPLVIEFSWSAEAQHVRRPSFRDDMLLLSEIVSTFHRQESQQRGIHQGSFYLQLEQMRRQVHASLDPKRTAMAIVNEAQQILACDRVSLVVPHRRKMRVAAVSGQTSVQPRSNVLKQMRSLAEAVSATGRAVWRPTWDPADSTTESLSSMLDSFQSESGSRCLAAIPLVRPPERAAAPAVSNGDESAHETNGVLLVEQYDEHAAFSRELADRIQAVAGIAAQGLENAQQHHQVFLLPVWRTLGGWLHGGRYSGRLRAAIAAVAILAILLALWLIPVQYKVLCDGDLQPAQRQFVFAPEEGIVIELHANYGTEVDAGSPLLDLQSDRLDRELERLLGELDSTRTRIRTLEARRGDTTQPRSDEPLDVSLELADVRQLEQAQLSELARLDRQRQNLFVTSPIAGQVITWELADRVGRRPVQRGQILCEVAQLDGEWVLELDVPDRRVARVVNAAERLGEELTVEFVLTSEPEETYVGRVIEYGEAVRLDPNAGLVMKIKVAIDKENIETLQPGTTVHAKIHCGRVSLGEYWFHDLFDFVRSQILFRLN